VLLVCAPRVCVLVCASSQVFRGPEDLNPLGATQAAGNMKSGGGKPGVSDTNLARFRAPEQCRYGDRCRHKLSCSRFHGVDPAIHAVNCACEESHCPKGHPLRAGRDRNTDQKMSAAAQLSAAAAGAANVARPGGLSAGKRPPPSYVCAKCKVAADHYLNECPQNLCFRCGQHGHIATHCTNERLPDEKRRTIPELANAPASDRLRVRSLDGQSDDPTGRNVQPRLSGTGGAAGLPWSTDAGSGAGGGFGFDPFGP